MTALPDFTEHDEHTKLRPPDGPKAPGPDAAVWLESVTGDRDRRDVRVLDLGCGNGGTVAWLLANGWDAYGLDVDPRYVENGETYLAEIGHSNRLDVIRDGVYPHPDEHFDIVLSDQVFEHVADLGALAREVARVTKPGGYGLHVFPGKWYLQEAHLGTPPVHWLPKGRAQRAAIALALKTGRAAPYFTDHSMAERVEIYADYCDSQTFYRSQRQIRRELGAAGFDVDARSILLGKAQQRGLPGPTAAAAAWLYRGIAQNYVVTRKR